MNSQTYLLHLKFDGSLDLIHFVTQLLRVSAHGWELSSLVQARPNQTRNLLDQSIRGNEGIILLCCGMERVT